MTDTEQALAFILVMVFAIGFLLGRLCGLKEAERDISPHHPISTKEKS